MDIQSRRDFLISAGAASVGFLGMQRLFGTARAGVAGAGTRLAEGFGPLRPDPAKIIDLPEGFTYRVISRIGTEMDDGLLVPGQPDGMATFAGPDGLTLIVRNHELSNDQSRLGAFGPRGERVARIDRDKLYDPRRGSVPAPGGTSTIVYDTEGQRVVRQFMSSAGHCRNCAGGVAPWGSWLTCEETVISAGEGGAARDHGYVFEVPATAEIGLAEPVPIMGMGRFNHEAVCIDPGTGIVYLTEDRGDGLLYRYIPETPGSLLEGGTLQALAVRGMPSFDTRNWASTTVRPGHEFATEWIDLQDITPQHDDLRERGYRAGAARFARGEGIHWADGGAYAVCTSGGHARKGQVWRYTPGIDEGTAIEEPGTIALFIEPNDGDVVDMPDNIGVAPWGDLVLCEDGGGDQFLVGVTPEGLLYKLARNAQNSSEFAGACFSPDGSTMFVNIQYAGLTLAITGPWQA